MKVMTEEKFVDIILNGSFIWNKVNDQPCIHTFYNEFYVNICLWHPNGKPTISIDVDDMENGVDDFISLNIEEKNQNFQSFLRMYNVSKNNAVNIAA